MRMLFSTGEAADICKVSQQTIIRCFDRGQLLGFRVPGSKFRRIPRDSLIQFMKNHDIPLHRFAGERYKILLISLDAKAIASYAQALRGDGRFEVKTADSGYEAGVLTHQFLPDVILLDHKPPKTDPTNLCRIVRQHENLRHIRIMVSSQPMKTKDTRDLIKAGVDVCLVQPMPPESLLQKVVEWVGR